MTRKQMKKIAKEIYNCELIRQNEFSTEEDKRKADNRVVEITGQIMTLQNGMNILLEIDALIQQLRNKKEND